MIDIEKLLELEGKATLAPWFADEDGEREGKGPHGVVWFNEFDRTAIFEGSYWSSHNEKLVAEMRNSIKDLCEELKAARQAIHAMRVFKLYDSQINNDDFEVMITGDVELLKALRNYETVSNRYFEERAIQDQELFNSVRNQKK